MSSTDVTKNDPPPGLPPELVGAVWIVAAGFAFSGMTLLIRPAAAELHTFQIIFVRNVLGVVLLGPWLFHRGSLAVWRSPNLGKHLVRAALIFGAMLCWFTAIPTVPISNAVALSFTSPIWVTLLAIVFLGERIQRRRATAITIGFIGVLVVVRPGFQAIGIGEILVLIDAGAWSAAVILIRIISRTESPHTIVTYMFLLLVPISAVPAFFVWTWPDLQTWVILAGIALTSTLGHYCSTRALAAAEASAIIPFDYLKLIWFTVGAWLFFDEVPESLSIVGAMIIAGSSIYILRREAKVAQKRLDEIGFTVADPEPASTPVAPDESRT